MSSKRSRSRLFVLLILTGAGLGAMLFSPWQAQTRAGETAGDPEVKVEDISTLPRVPIYGEDPLGTNEKSVTVTLWPSPLPSGKTVTVNISKTPSSLREGATFDDGTTSKDITETTTLKVRGTENSSAKDNMKLAATYEGNELDNRTFTVSTWPYDWKTTLKAEYLGFGFEVDLTWKSESGSRADLTTVLWREYVTNPTVGTNPPFNHPPRQCPYIVPSNILGYDLTTRGEDEYRYLPSWVDWSTQTPGSMVYAQDYQFWDFVLNTKWEDGVLGTGIITREVASFPGGSYVFVTTVDGTGYFNHTCQESP